MKTKGVVLNLISIIIIASFGTYTASEEIGPSLKEKYQVLLSCTQVGVLDSTFYFDAALVRESPTAVEEPDYFTYIWTDGADRTVHPVQAGRRHTLVRNYFGDVDVIPGIYNMTVQVYRPRRIGKNDTLIAQNLTSFSITELLNVNISATQKVKYKQNNGTTFATGTNISFHAETLDQFSSPQILNMSYFYHWTPSASEYKDKKEKSNNFTYVFTSSGEQHMTLNTTIEMILNNTNNTRMVKTKLSNVSLVLKDAVEKLILQTDSALVTEHKFSGTIMCEGSNPLNITVCHSRGDGNESCYYAANLEKCMFDVSLLNIVFHQGGKYTMNFTVANTVSVLSSNYTLQVNVPDYTHVNQFVPIFFGLMVILIITAAIGYSVHSRKTLMEPVDPEVASFEFNGGSGNFDRPSLLQRFKSTDFGKFIFANYRAGEKRGEANYASFSARYDALKEVSS